MIHLLQGLLLTAGAAELNSETTIPLSWMFAIGLAMVGSLGAFGAAFVAFRQAGKVEPLQLQVTQLEKELALLKAGTSTLEKALERVERDIQNSIRGLKENLEARQKEIHDSINKLQATLLNAQRNQSNDLSDSGKRRRPRDEEGEEK